MNHPNDLRAERARCQPGDANVLEIELEKVLQFIAFEME